PQSFGPSCPVQYGRRTEVHRRHRRGHGPEAPDGRVARCLSSRASDRLGSLPVPGRMSAFAYRRTGIRTYPAKTMSHTTKDSRTNGSFAAIALAGLALWLIGMCFGAGHRSIAFFTLRAVGILLLLSSAWRRRSLLVWTFLAMLAGVELGLD